MNNILKKIYLLILFLGVICSLLIGNYTYTNNLEKEQIHFNSLTNNLILNIKNSMDTYREVLYSGLGFFEASNEVTREEWHIFVNKLQIKKYFPGIQGLGYSIVLREEELQKNIEDIRKQGFPQYKIRPEGKRDLYTSIIYLEPFDNRNQRAFGFDMYSEQNRRKAMNRTIETNSATLSTKVTLVQENGNDVQSGFLLYTPLYKKNTPIETKEERHAAIKGFVYAVFRTKDFITAALGNSLEVLDIKMYDGKTKNNNALLFDSSNQVNNGNKFVRNIEIELNGRFWTFEIGTKEAFFIDSQKTIYSFIFTILGLLITFLITLLIKRQSAIEKLKDDALFNISQGVTVTNSNREIIYTNKAFEELSGYSRDFIYGQQPDFLQGVDTDLESIQFIKESLKKLKPFECEILNYKKDGTSFWNRLSVTPILDEKNNLKRFIGIQNDITDKKILEKEMLFEKNLIENILNNTSAIIALIDMNGVMVKLNDYGKNFVGHTQEEISSKPYFWQKFITEKLRKNIKDFVKEARKDNLIEKIKNPWISSTGEEKIFEWSNKLLKDLNGKPQYIITVGIDVTNDAIAQEELKKFQKQLSLSAKISGLAFWELNLKTNTFTFNDLFYTFIETTVEEEGGYHIRMEDYFEKYIPETSRQIFINTIIESYKKTNDYQGSFEHELKKNDGLILQVLVNYHVDYDNEGTPNKIYGTKYNLTKQKEKENILIEAKEQAEYASKVKSEFLANMSHEIRTPLNGIIGLTNLMLETQLSDLQKNYLTKSIVSSEALLHVINDILDYSKIEANKIEIENIPFELDKLLHQVTNLFIYEAQNKNIELTCTITPSVHNNLVGDPFRINQVLINLVGNALKFTSKGTIHIKVDAQELKDNKMQLSFIVKDTGIGISKNKQEKLFQYFSQVDTSNTREYGGSGLGLAISKKLANLMGGEISIESIEEKGSTFSFTSVVEYVKKDYKILSQNLKEKKVLIVNSNTEIRQLIQEKLKTFSLNTKVCNNAESALAILENENFDYIIIEWELSGIDGIEFIKIVEERYPHKNIKTILLSDFNKRDELINVVKKSSINTNQILVRPFSSSSLLNILVNNSELKLEEDENTQKLLAKGDVLLVEDNEINQLVAKHNLENFGLKVFIAENGAVAVEKAKEKHFDIIFMDLQMPIMDGFEASKKIKEFAPTTPIIALTAAVMQEDLKMTQKAGMNKHLAKPIDIEKLKEVLQEYLETTNQNVSENKHEVIIEDFIEGVDIQELIERLSNNKKLAYEMLRNFSKDKKDIVQEIDSLDIEASEFNFLMHNLKGLSGNLSLTDVYKYSTELYTSNNLESKKRILPKLKESLTLVIKSINENTKSKTLKTNIKKDFSKDEILKNIRELSHDISKGAFIDQDRKSLIIDQIAQISSENTSLEIEKYLAKFDYKNALSVLERTIGELN